MHGGGGRGGSEALAARQKSGQASPRLLSGPRIPLDTFQAASYELSSERAPVCLAARDPKDTDRLV